MKRLSLLFVFVLVACGSGLPSAREDSSGIATTAGDIQPVANTGSFYREGLSGVDFSGLDAVKKERALKLMNAEPCDSGCGMTNAQCRVEDKTCPRSPSLAAAVVNAIRSGASDQQAMTALKALRDQDRDAAPADGAAPAAKAVPAVNINVDNSPAMGPADATITVVTFEDFQ